MDEAVSLSKKLGKGENVSLTKGGAGPTMLVVGLRWNERATDGQEYDLDASALLLGAGEKVRKNTDFVFYNNLGDVSGDPDENGVRHADQEKACVIHLGDNRDGSAGGAAVIGDDGDKESIAIDLTRIPADVEKIVFVVSIDDAENRNQNFGQVTGASIRVMDGDTGKIIESDGVMAQYDLAEEAAKYTTCIFGEVYRYNGNWKFRAIGNGFLDGFAGLVRAYGVGVKNN